MDYLTVRELAELRNCSLQYIQRQIKDSKLTAELDANPNNRHKQYLIPVSALDAALQRKYYGKLKDDVAPLAPDTVKVRRALEDFTADEREQITYWMDVVDEWQRYRSNPAIKCKTKLDKQFILSKQMSGMEISIATLYRAWTAIKNGELEELVDNRGKSNKGKSSIDKELWDVFLYLYLDERQLPILKCYDLTKDWAQEYQPHLLAGIPHHSAFYRRLDRDIDDYVIVCRREGMKAYEDRYAPYIDRLYDDLKSNDYWVGDNHTLDIFSRASEGETEHRLHLTAFIDALSGIFTGIYVGLNPCADSTMLALRDGVMRCGVPVNMLLDNGSEFLTHDIGGRGHRTKRKYKNEEQPPTIFKLLGINMVNAQVRNAKAKPIERTFGTLKNHFSRMWETYCGGNVLERPEKLKKVLKDGNIPLDTEVTEALTEFCFEYYNHQPYTGKVKRFQGMTRMEVFKANLFNQRTSTVENLNLLLMRHSRLQQVGRIGVHIDVAGQRLNYWNEELLERQSRDPDKRVYVRYDPQDLGQVYIYDKDDRYLMTVQQDEFTCARWGDSKEKVQQSNQLMNSAKRAAKAKAKAYGDIDPEKKITLLSKLAIQNSNAGVDEPVKGKVVTPLRPKEDSIPKKLVTDEIDYRDLVSEERMNRNSQRDGLKRGVG